MRLLLALAICAATLLPAVRSDAEIEADIRARFAKSKISTNQFQVKVKGGTAVLTGRTDVIQHKGVATRLAKLGGARAVDNQIRISEAAAEKAAARLADARKARSKETRGESRSEPRSERRSEARREQPEPAAPAEAASPAPPPVRRAVVKR